MNKVTLFLMTEKGFEVLKAIVAEQKQLLISKVIGSRDKSVQEDYYSAIQQMCKDNQIPFFDRTEKTAIESRYAIAISWRWLIRGKVELIVLHDSILPK